MRVHWNKEGVIACGRFYLTNCKHAADPNDVTCVKCRAAVQKEDLEAKRMAEREQREEGKRDE